MNSKLAKLALIASLGCFILFWNNNCIVGAYSLIQWLDSGNTSNDNEKEETHINEVKYCKSTVNRRMMKKLRSKRMNKIKKRINYWMTQSQLNLLSKKIHSITLLHLHNCEQCIFYQLFNSVAFMSFIVEQLK